MDITDGETPGGDGLPGPASRKLKGTTKKKLNAETLKPEIQSGDSGANLQPNLALPKEREAEKWKPETCNLPVDQVSPEHVEAIQWFIGEVVSDGLSAGLDAPPAAIESKPVVPDWKAKVIKIVGNALLPLMASGLVCSVLAHPAQHNNDGSHKTVQMQPGGRRQEIGGQRSDARGQVLPDGESEDGGLKAEVGGPINSDQHQSEILRELQLHRDILDRLARGQQKMLRQFPLPGLGQCEPVSDDEARRLFALLSALETETSFRKAPVIHVFTLYCRDGKSRKAVARACHCSPALVSLRLQAIERKLGRKASELRQISDQFERMDDALSDSRARRIHRQSAMDEPEDEEDGF